MKWRLIEQQTFDASMNMAIDHAIYESVASNRELPTIRLYKWKNNSVSIGAYQNEKEIGVEECTKNNVDVVRRMTGGRAVYHDKADFTYSVIAHIREFRYSIESAYREICVCLLNTLNDLGIKAKIENKNDILVRGRKISGNAAKAMEKGIYLQHGTLVYSLDMDLMPKILGVSHQTIKEKVISISDLKKISQKKVHDCLRMNFAFGKDITASALSGFEMERAEHLAGTIYKGINLPPGEFRQNKGACYVERGGN